MKISTKLIRETLNKSNPEISADMAGITFEDTEVYLYAFYYYDNSSSDVSMMFKNENVTLTEDQKTIIFDFIKQEVNKQL